MSTLGYKSKVNLQTLAEANTDDRVEENKFVKIFTYILLVADKKESLLLSSGIPDQRSRICLLVVSDCRLSNVFICRSTCTSLNFYTR